MWSGAAVLAILPLGDVWGSLAKDNLQSRGGFAQWDESARSQKEHDVMESANTRSEPVKVTPFLPWQITTRGLGGTAKVV